MKKDRLKAFLNDKEDIGQLIYMTLLAAERFEEAAEHLNDLICLCLDEKRDDLLLDAISYAQASDHQQKMKSVIANFTLFSIITKKPYSDQDATLFAIPVLFFSKEQQYVPVHLNNMPLMVSFFRREHLITDDTTIFLRNELYTYEDLDLKPSEHRQLFEECVNSFCFGKTNQPYFNSLTPPRTLQTSECQLRFMVCLAISKNDAHPFCIENQSSNDYVRALSEWEEEFRTEIKNQTEFEAVMVSEPRPLHLALRRGLTLFNHFNVRLSSTNAVRKATKNLSRCHALISWHCDNDETEYELRVSFFNDDPSLIERCVVKMDGTEESFEYYSKHISKTLMENHVDSIENIEEALPMEVNPSIRKIYTTAPKPTLH